MGRNNQDLPGITGNNQEKRRRKEDKTHYKPVGRERRAGYFPIYTSWYTHQGTHHPCTPSFPGYTIPTAEHGRTSRTQPRSPLTALTHHVAERRVTDEGVTVSVDHGGYRQC